MIHRRAVASKINPLSLTPLDMLACMGEWAMGALVYRPETEEPVDTGAIDLDRIAAQSRQVLKGAPEALFPTLLRVGGSPGGARPKAVVCRDDPSGALIHGAHLSAAERKPEDAGLLRSAVVRPCRSGRLHLHSACGHLHVDFQQPSLDYKTLMILTFQLTKDHRQVVEMFRRAAFNLFAHNRDDHGRQFAYLMDRTGNWSLAPAYDLAYADGPGSSTPTTPMSMF